VRDLILRAPIDIFQAIDFDRVDRIAELVDQSPQTLEDPFGQRVGREAPDAWWPASWHTPLAWAVVSGKPAAVRTLLERGATHITSPDGRTLRAIAEAAGHTEIVELLAT